MKSTIDRLLQAEGFDLVDDLLDVPHVVDEEDRLGDPLLATGRVAEGQVDRRPPGQDQVRVGGELAPGFLPLIVGQLAEDPDDPEVVGDDDRVDRPPIPAGSPSSGPRSPRRSG